MSIAPFFTTFFTRTQRKEWTFKQSRRYYNWIWHEKKTLVWERRQDCVEILLPSEGRRGLCIITWINFQSTEDEWNDNFNSTSIFFCIRHFIKCFFSFSKASIYGDFSICSRLSFFSVKKSLLFNTHASFLLFPYSASVFLWLKMDGKTSLPLQ